MGKGAGECEAQETKSSVGMGDLLVESIQGADLRRSILEAKVAQKNNSGYTEENNYASAALDRAKTVETRERKFHLETLDQLHELRQSGASQKKLNSFLNMREQELKLERNLEFDEFLQSQNVRPEREYSDDDDAVPLTARQLEGRRAASHIVLFDNKVDSLPEEVRFQAEFFGSKEFIENWQNELSDAGLNPKTDYATATGKSAEDCWRDATRQTLGLSKEQIAAGDTLASWTSPSGSHYDIEIMSEFSKTALFDLILRARREGSDETAIITNQQKSTARNTKPKDDRFNPEPEVVHPEYLKVKLTQVSGNSSGKDEPYRRYSLAETAREFQIRMLATSSITETSPLVQQDDAKRAWFAHHTSRVSLPGVHRAIATHPDLTNLFKPVKTSTDFKDPKTGKTRRHDTWRLEARVPVQGLDKPVILQTSIFLSSARKKSNGDWSVDKELTGARDGSIMINIPGQGWLDLHRIDTAGIGLLTN